MRGHWYVTLERDGERVEFAVPAVLGTLEAIDVAEAALPGWAHPAGAITWRVDFDRRKYPADSQPGYQLA